MGNQEVIETRCKRHGTSCNIDHFNYIFFSSLLHVMYYIVFIFIPINKNSFENVILITRNHKNALLKDADSTITTMLKQCVFNKE